MAPVQIVNQETYANVGHNAKVLGSSRPMQVIVITAVRLD